MTTLGINNFFGKDIMVDNTQKIGDALNLAEPYDRIIISEGTYYEHSLEITKPLEIIGINYPLIDGHKKGNVFVISSDDVTLRGIAITGSAVSSMYDYAGIKVENSSRVTISENRLEENFFGIMLAGSDSCLISANEIRSNSISESSSGNGIHLWKCSSVTISGNFIRGHRDGIYFEFVTEGKVLNNFSSQNIRYGLHFMFSHNNIYRDNIFINNGAGVAVMYSRQVEMINNSFIENTGANSYGLLLKDITDSYLEKNIFRSNTTGLYAEGSNRIKINSNTFIYNGWAVKMLGNCEDNLTENCIFTGNSFDVATNSTRTMSLFRRNYWDKYTGFDLDKDGIGDVPYYPVTMFSVLVHRTPESVFLLRSFVVDILNLSEKILPVITPENLVDNYPLIKEPDLN
ncbi:MAG: nitrous oxide reductase family maturation protein NosD [Ignavibacteria bacterium]|nr:nitrous oxide reductase family maturation protein NosD [Ignavibacteria bacterium]